MVWLLEWYSPAYASNQFRALQQVFKWLAHEEETPNPMAAETAACSREVCAGLQR
jgi:integrase/recombinase XerD